ncbi:MAG: hypothetical protein J6S67_20480 [Methanobrevibacter sp.]|nr:hypothetical protein [Methanobrevibacter sp.]
MTELPKTEQELNDLIAAKVQEATAEQEAKHNGQMATLRKKYDDDLKKAKEQAGKTAEEIAQERIKEQQEHDAQELTELRQFKKNTVLSEKLKKEGLPDFFKNDTRLLNAEDGNVDKVIKDIKKEFEAIQPKGATHSTVVQTQSQSVNKQQDDKSAAFEKMGDAIKELIK